MVTHMFTRDSYFVDAMELVEPHSKVSTVDLTFANSVMVENYLVLGHQPSMLENQADEDLWRSLLFDSLTVQPMLVREVNGNL